MHIKSIKAFRLLTTVTVIVLRESNYQERVTDENSCKLPKSKKELRHNTLCNFSTLWCGIYSSTAYEPFAQFAKSFGSLGVQRCATCAAAKSATLENVTKTVIMLTKIEMQLLACNSEKYRKWCHIQQQSFRQKTKNLKKQHPKEKLLTCRKPENLVPLRWRKPCRSKGCVQKNGTNFN